MEQGSSRSGTTTEQEARTATAPVGHTVPVARTPLTDNPAPPTRTPAPTEPAPTHTAPPTTP